MAPRGMNEQAIPYEDRLLRGHRRYLERVAHAKMLAKLALEAGEDVEVKPRQAHTAVDAIALRGLPAIGRGVSGAIAGTQPGHNLFR